MPKYEYCNYPIEYATRYGEGGLCINIPGKGLRSINDFGNEGWELVIVINESYKYKGKWGLTVTESKQIAIFKRQKKE